MVRIALALLGLMIAAPALAELREEANVTSPDGRIAAVILVQPGKGSSQPERSRLELRDRKDGTLRTVVAVPPQNGRLEDSFARVRDPVFGNESEAVYVLADAAPVRAVQRVDVRTGQVRFVIDGDDVRVIRSGKYRGNLIVWRGKLRKTGMAYREADLVRPDGIVALAIPASDTDGEKAVARWLKAQHATAE